MNEQLKHQLLKIEWSKESISKVEISQEKLQSSEQQMEATIEETNSLSQEVVKFNRSIEALKRTLSLQRSPLNKSGLGYSQ